MSEKKKTSRDAWISRLDEIELESLRDLLHGLSNARPLEWTTGEPELELELDAARLAALEALKSMRDAGIFGDPHADSGEEQ